MAVVHTACTYDCPDACGLLVDTGGDGLLALAVLRLLSDRGQLDPAAANRLFFY